MVISYALAADNPERVVALVAAEIPGAPGVVPAPPLFVPQPLNNKLWHIPFNRAGKIAEQLIQGHEDVYFGYEFAIQGGPALPQEVIDYYIDNFADPESLAGGLGFYRDWDATMAQNKERATQTLSIPVLAIGGDESYGDHVADGMRPAARTCRASSSPAPATGWLNRRPTSCSPSSAPSWRLYREAHPVGARPEARPCPT